MVMYTVFFTIVNLLIAAWWWCTRNTKRKARIFELLLVGNFFIYSGMSSVIFSTIPCVDYDYGDKTGTVRLLRADRTCPCCAVRPLPAVLTHCPLPALVALLCTTVGIDCDSSAHQLAVSWAGLMAVAYPLGIPTGYWLLLRGNQAAIMADGRGNDPSLDPIRFLFANYSPNAWYFEPIVCVEKLILVGVVVFFFPGTLSQLGITAANASGFLSVYSWIKPFGEQTLDLHGVSAQVSVVAAAVA